MKTLVLLLLLIGAPLYGSNKREDDTWEFFASLTSASDEKISVRIITGPWEPSEHKIEKKVGDAWKPIPKAEERHADEPVAYRIDGRKRIWGADGFGWPDREVKLFVVRWADRTINVPRKHWRDYYGLLLYSFDETKHNSSIGGCWTRAAIDPITGELVITANGGGGAGWYRATWRIKSDGTITDSAESTAE